MVSEVWVTGLLALLFVVGEAGHGGGRIWGNKTAYLMVARKQKGNEERLGTRTCL